MTNFETQAERSTKKRLMELLTPNYPLLPCIGDDLGHSKSRIMGSAQRKIDGAGVQFAGVVESCEICLLNKIKQIPYLKKTEHNVTHTAVPSLLRSLSQISTALRNLDLLLNLRFSTSPFHLLFQCHLSRILCRSLESINSYSD